MQKNIDYKIPGGKLLRISCNIEDNTIIDIRITGDFYLHPEEAIVDIENAILGRKLEWKILIDTIKSVTENVKMVGVSCESIADALCQA